MDNAAVRSVLTYPEDDDLHDQHSYLPFKRISPETKVIALEHWGEKQEQQKGQLELHEILK